ncbi:GDSL-type esterase/lipase family protein [Hespellia stercorisuis]|uniref:Lysophospholipase L1 n=1 Tax=Hespellia stercorisuis DSM 15480 TaxID=1121950 RepID=A0A1M6QPM0_9FIRM|nr:GDSL-type esterase/lipase family protein [Hespellia stercorisuis]SHK22184.1 Lysophospholipase L1 [Hespellia stercorisuis DSM 15480]
MKIDKRKVAVLIIGVIVVIVALFGVVKLVERFTTKKTDTSEGLAIIKEEEDKSVQDVEKRIQNLEDRDVATAEELANRTPKEIFANSVVMGDSITQGFADYDILDTSSVIADRGVELDELGSALETVEALSPQVIFLAYGMNDVIGTNGDSALFKEQYSAVLDELSEKLPNTRVFVNSIFPVQQVEIDNQPLYKNLDKYNKVLKELCDERQISFIDNTEIATSDYYEDDGVHLKADFYPIWASRMTEVASL